MANPAHSGIATSLRPLNPRCRTALLACMKDYFLLPVNADRMGPLLREGALRFIGIEEEMKLTNPSF